MLINNSTRINDTKTVCFEKQIDITRPADITAYAIGDTINNLTDITLPYFDLSSFKPKDNKFILTSVDLYSSADISLNCNISFLNKDSYVNTSDNNNAYYTDTFAHLNDYKVNTYLGSEFVNKTIAGGVIRHKQLNVNKILISDSSFKVYLAIIANAVAVHASSEKMSVIIRGTFVGQTI
jgi:hypothetical protein